MGNDANEFEHIAPTPWKCGYHENSSVIVDARARDVCASYGEDGPFICDCIIARVNAYPELVAMVRELRTAILDAAYTTEQCQRALHRSDTILAKVSNA